MSLPVAVSSDDPEQPMLFGSPGVAAPLAWSVERRGARQHGSGLTRVTRVTLGTPSGFAGSTALNSVVRAIPLLHVESRTDVTWSLVLEIYGTDGATHQIALPPTRA